MDNPDGRNDGNEVPSTGLTLGLALGIADGRGVSTEKGDDVVGATEEATFDGP